MTKPYQDIPKIEAKGDKCKITFYAQNLRSDSNDYHALAICNKKDNKNIRLG